MLPNDKKATINTLIFKNEHISDSRKEILKTVEKRQTTEDRGSQYEIKERSQKTSNKMTTVSRYMLPRDRFKFPSQKTSNGRMDTKLNKT